MVAGSDLLPDGRLVEITESYTVVPLDQPVQLAEAVRAFVTEHRREPAVSLAHGVSCQANKASSFSKLSRHPVSCRASRS